MFGHDHHHHHHDESCDHAPVQETDPAAKSMAEALRLSFRLLTAIMVLILVAFLWTGATTIGNYETGIKTVFGRVAGVVGPGLQYNWPFPVGAIEKIPASQQTIELRDFWMFEAAEDKAQPDLTRRQIRGEGLQPGLDGALLTGDSYLFHVLLKCTYVIRDPLAYRGRFQDANEAIHSALCSAAIKAAATRTAEGLMGGGEQDQFKAEVINGAQKTLDSLGVGVSLTLLNVTQATWPLRALPAYEAAQNAGQKAASLVRTARKEAEELVGNVAGPNYAKLVGEPWLSDAQLAAVTAQRSAGEDYNLIDRYDQTRRKGEAQKAAEILQRIDDILLSRSTTGEVATMISGAQAYKDGLKQAVIARLARFEKLLPEYQKAPDFLLDREWARTREEILSNPAIIKWIWTFGKEKTTVYINTPPEINKAVLADELKSAQDANNTSNK